MVIPNFWYCYRYLLRRLLSQLKDSNLTSLYAKSLHTYGSWIACTRTEHAQQVLEKYLIPVSTLLDNIQT